VGAGRGHGTPREGKPNATRASRSPQAFCRQRARTSVIRRPTRRGVLACASVAGMARSRPAPVALPRSPSSRAASTKASAVLDRLRAEIVHGIRPPGEKLRLEHLAPRYGVGRTPLREACCRLAAEGLVTIEDQRGFR